MKYIDAEKLIESLEKIKQAEYENCGETGLFQEVQELIDSLQQEQPNDVCAEIKEYYGEELAFEDERTKAAYHFFSAGKAFELREYKEERKKHITDLLDNFQKGMNAGYEKAISELKEGKVECSPVMKELIDKLFGIGNTFNFGFGPKNIQLEQPSLPDNLKLNMTRTKLELNEIETLTHLVRVKAVEPGHFQGLYKGILSKLNKMFDEEYAERERKEERL